MLNSEVRSTIVAHPWMAPAAQKRISANTSQGSNSQGSSAGYVIASAYLGYDGTQKTDGLD